MTNARNENNPLETWALDREIVLSRVVAAPRDLVFKAWTDPQHLPLWFGPKGFRIETEEIDIRVGGQWRFVLFGPDGTRWDSRMVFLKIDPPRLLQFDHGSDVDNDPGRFRTSVTFDEQTNGKTVVTLRQLHPTKAQRDAGIGFGAVEFGYETLEKLARHLDAEMG
ncbi:SRPBCC family protein [Hyphomonas johnsonii]|uniref:Activator of Hsp90 ATPase 1 family protein n=1 Tax=Hyphomonas johnsonii MHS-2 TaxID=1280950 RepID=A0A059FPB1_9PROT|nr:SRPBCC family protein [Hyphomonas johnsonii]KCZ92366.1 activator of Hsp90 ATPase 1 family protein [Hyphomonas johnsonii MHS-2]